MFIDFPFDAEVRDAVILLAQARLNTICAQFDVALTPDLHAALLAAYRQGLADGGSPLAQLLIDPT